MSSNSHRAQNALRPIMDGDRVVIMGLGKSGLSAALLCKQFGAEVIVSDSNPPEKLDAARCRKLIEADISLEAGSHSEELFCSATCIIASPGIPLNLNVLENARRKGIPVVGEMSLASIYLKTPIVAVTGTNGKTTVTTLLGDIFRASGKKVFVGGNIGTPLTDYLAGPQDADVVILEISSFQLDSAIGFKPKVALLLNISPDHLDRYNGYEDYVASKFSIFMNQSEADYSILNADDHEISRGIESKTSLKHGWAERSILSFSSSNLKKKGAVLQDQKVKLVIEEKEEVFDLSQTELRQSPNSQNAMAAILAARVLGCRSEGIRKGLQCFKGLSHRLTPIGNIGGVIYLDDSKATNIGAVNSALASIENPVLLIAGGRDKGGDYSLLSSMVKEKVKTLLLIGEAKDKMATALKGDADIEILTTLESAVKRANEIAVTGDVVLLSPACASFDMFSSYAERGNVFKEIVCKISDNKL